MCNDESTLTPGGQQGKRESGAWFCKKRLCFDRGHRPTGAEAVVDQFVKWSNNLVLTIPAGIRHLGR
jgi:hypothetical protein